MVLNSAFVLSFFPSFLSKIWCFLSVWVSWYVLLLAECVAWDVRPLVNPLYLCCFAINLSFEQIKKVIKIMKRKARWLYWKLIGKPMRFLVLSQRRLKLNYNYLSWKKQETTNNCTSSPRLQNPQNILPIYLSKMLLNFLLLLSQVIINTLATKTFP